MYCTSMNDFNQAENYDLTSSIQREDGLNLISCLSPEEGSKVLDLGCGTGYLTKVLANKVGSLGKVIAIDPDMERLQVARKKYSTSNIDYLVGKAESITGGPYDIIFSNNALHWCRDKKPVFKQISNSLSKDGRFGFVVTGTANYNLGATLFPPEELLLNPKHRLHMMSQIHPFTPDEIAELTTTNGLEVKFSSEQWHAWRFEDEQKLIDFYLTNFQYKGTFNRHDFNIKAIKDHFGCGEIVLNVPYITVIAQKI